MTLRVTLEIVPYGNENHKQEIFHADIVNVQEVENLGFGHTICKYDYFVYKPIPEIIRDGLVYERLQSGTIDQHDRRDGAWALVEKVIKDMGDI